MTTRRPQPAAHELPTEENLTSRYQCKSASNLHEVNQMETAGMVMEQWRSRRVKEDVRCLAPGCQRATRT